MSLPALHKPSSPPNRFLLQLSAIAEPRSGNPVRLVADGTGVCHHRAGDGAGAWWPTTREIESNLDRSTLGCATTRQANKPTGRRSSGVLDEKDESNQRRGDHCCCLSLVLVGCGSESDSTQESATTKTSEATVAPGSVDTTGPNPTIATYVQENHIQETPIHRGDPGAPNINLPVPEGWADAGGDIPEWAYSAIVYTGPEAAQ